MLYDVHLSGTIYPTPDSKGEPFTLHVSGIEAPSTDDACRIAEEEISALYQCDVQQRRAIEKDITYLG